MKKGSILDMFFLVTFALGIAITFVIGWVVYSNINTNFQANSGIATQAKTMMANTNSRMVNWFDWSFLAIFIGIYLSAVILAFQIESHPIFFPISIFLFIVLVIVSAALANTYFDFSSNPTLTSYADDFIIITFIMNNLVKIIIPMAFGLAWIIWGRPR